MKKFLAVFITSLLVLAGLVAAPAAQAAGLSAHVYLSDYTPANNEEIHIYVEGFSANTEYSFGYAWMYDNEDFDGNVDWTPPVDGLGEFTTDSAGRANFDYTWFFGENEHDLFSGTYTSKIWVNESGEVPTSYDDAIAWSSRVKPGQNWGIGNIGMSGSGFDTNGFKAGQVVDFQFFAFNPNIDSFEFYMHDDTTADTSDEFWNNVMETGDFPFIGDCFGDNGEANCSITIPEDNISSKIMVFYFSDYTEEHSAGWFYLDADSTLEEPSAAHTIANVPSKVREYSYSKIVYGQPDFRDQNNGLQIKILSKNCFSMGDGIIYMTAGKCKWVVKDSEKNIVQRGSTNVVKSASKRNSVWLRHFSVNYKKGKTVVSRAVDSKIRAEWNSDDFYNIVAIGHAWNEGSKKKMKKLSKDRTDAIHDYFTNTYGELSVSTILWGWSGADLPLAKKGKKSAQNRRVEIIEVQPGMWVW